MYGMGVAVGDYNNDGFPDILITCVGQNRLFRNTGKGTFVDVTQAERPRRPPGASAPRRCGSTTIATACSICSSATTCSGRPSTTSSAASTASTSPTARPRRIAATPAGCFTIAATARSKTSRRTSGIFDSSSKSLGVAMLDYDHDGWPDLLVANDTQPNKLYRNLRNGTFKDVGVEAGVAFSSDGKARAGMGVDAADFDNSGTAGHRHHQFRQRNDRPVSRACSSGAYDDVAARSPASGGLSKNSLGFGCAFCDVDLDGSLDLVVANGHIDDTVRNIRGNVGYAQPPHLFLNDGNGKFRDVAARSRRRLRPAEGRPRPGLRRLRSRRRPRSADDHQQRPGVSLSQRSARRQSQHPLPPDRHEIESRRHRRRRPHRPRRHDASRAW